MATFLFDTIVFGPIKSRRLGISLGVNLLSNTNKICNFNCIYCECGWNKVMKGQKLRYADAHQTIEELKTKLHTMHANNERLDVITFAGNGEPTMHPQFAQIIDEAVDARNHYFPEAKIAVLSNATMLGREVVREALKKVDSAILKIDSALEPTINAINQPNFKYSLRDVIDNMKFFKGEIIIQTMFLRGEYGGIKIDNTTSEEVAAWLNVVKEIKPKLVMIYSIDRDTPAENLQKVSFEDMNNIATFVRENNIDCSVAQNGTDE
ncbi:MAG: radical SAM protein [Rikenellaceae bacterium]